MHPTCLLTHSNLQISEGRYRNSQAMQVEGSIELHVVGQLTSSRAGV